MMRIGILIKDFAELQNWELRLIDQIRNTPSLELSVLIKDGRGLPATLGGRINGVVTAKSSLSKALFTLQTKIESKVFKVRTEDNAPEVISFLSQQKTLICSPVRQGYFDIFSEADAKAIEGYELDVLLQLGFQLLSGPLLRAARHGVWSFYHGENSLQPGDPVSFWEMCQSQDVLSVALLQVTDSPAGGSVIDRAFFNKHWSFYKSFTQLQEESVILFFRNLARLSSGELTLESPSARNLPLFRTMAPVPALGYMFSFGANLLKKAWRKVAKSYLGARYDCWTLFIGEGRFMEADLTQLKPVVLPKNEFWADPFLFKYQGEHYLFFENYLYDQNRGKVSCGKVKDGQLTDVVDVLDRPYHLSYPFMFEEDGEIYMMPETYQASQVEIYRCVQFPDKWELYSTAFEGETIADTSYYRDEDGQRWLFLNRGYNDYCNNLYIYQIDSPRLDNVRAHRQNPVLVDSRVARNAGAIFREGSKRIRPSQNNSTGIYGYGLNLNEIKTLTLDTYEEVHLRTIAPTYHPGLQGTHHLHQVADMFVIDGAFKKV